MTIEHLHKKGEIWVNMVETACYTCWSAGDILYQKHNGYGDTPKITTEELIEAQEAAYKHEKKTNGKHRIRVVLFERIKT